MQQKKLAALRRYNDISQKRMAELLEIDLRTYINKEMGVTQFKANEMFAIAKILQMNISDIFLPNDFINHEVTNINLPPYNAAGGGK